MKCHKCFTDNPEDSLYCEECGAPLETEEKPIQKEVKKPKEKTISQEIEDVIFVPKRKKRVDRTGLWVVLVGTGFLTVLIVLAFTNISGSSLTQTTGLPITPTPTYFNSAYLQLSNTKMYGNTSGMPNPVFEGTLHNSGALTAKNVVVRFNFYDSKEVNAVPVDTQYMTVANYLGPGDSTLIKTVVKTNANTAGNFWWRAEVYYAEE
jgi:hypothetical protein